MKGECKMTGDFDSPLGLGREKEDEQVPRERQIQGYRDGAVE